MNKLSEKSSKHWIIILIPIILILIFILISWLYETFFGYYITAKFSESGPLYTNMPVYYNGYRIGKIQKIKLSEDYKYTLVKMRLYPKEPKLPENIIAKAKNHDVIKEYIDLIIPDQPSDILIKNGSTVEGKAAFDLEGFLSDIADSGIIVPLLQNFSDTLISANKTSVEIKNFFSDSRLVLKENRQNLKQTTKDLAQSTKSLTKLTSNLNKSVAEGKINNTTLNVNKASGNILTATENIKNITASVDCATKNLGQTMAKIDSTLSDTKVITSNVKTITRGFCEVLHQRFAGLRIIFGKPLNNKCCPKNCYK